VIAADIAKGSVFLGSDPVFGNDHSLGIYVVDVLFHLGLSGACFVGALVLLGVAAILKTRSAHGVEAKKTDSQ
jgi:hypothetical protein